MDELLTLVSSTGYAFAKWGWAKAPAGDYGVISMGDPDTFMADSRHAETAERLYVDYFTRTDGEAAREAIETAMKTMRSMWWLESIQYEEETNFVHLEWVVVRLGKNEL